MIKQMPNKSHRFPPAPAFFVIAQLIHEKCGSRCLAKCATQTFFSRQPVALHNVAYKRLVATPQQAPQQHKRLTLIH